MEDQFRRELQVCLRSGSGVEESRTWTCDTLDAVKEKALAWLDETALADPGASVVFTRLSMVARP